MTLDPVREYLQSISRFPLLTAEQEIQLSRKVAQYMELRDLKDLTPDQKRQIKAGLKARNKIVSCNLRLVMHIAKRYTGRLKSNHMTIVDLCQEGSIGLQRAAEKFDPTRGYKFSTYAYWWVRQAITRAIDMQERVIKVPGYFLDNCYKAQRLIAEYMQTHGRNPTIKEISEIMQLTADSVLALLEANLSHVSLDQLIIADGGSLLDLIASPEVFEEIDLSYNKEHLESAIFYLNDKERDIINKRYNEQWTLLQIGERHNISRERARQKLDQILRKLKRMASGSYTFPPTAPL